MHTSDSNRSRQALFDLSIIGLYYWVFDLFKQCGTKMICARLKSLFLNLVPRLKKRVNSPKVHALVFTPIASLSPVHKT